MSPRNFTVALGYGIAVGVTGRLFKHLKIRRPVAMQPMTLHTSKVAKTVQKPVSDEESL